MATIVYTAQWLLPVARPPIRDGALAVSAGRVVGCGRLREIVDSVPHDERRDLGAVAVLPGLVNAHTHLELSWMADDRPPGGDWLRWVRGLVERRASEARERADAAANSAVERMLARGTVAIGDVGNRGWSVPVLAGSELHAVAFLEAYGFRREQAPLLLAEAEALLARLQDFAGQRLKIVLAPHAPHTTSPALVQAIGERAAAGGDPLSIHVAESAAECAFLRDGSGPFAAFLHERAGAEPGWRGVGCSPVRHLQALGVLTGKTLAVHCVHLESEDVALLRAHGVTVVTCPRSNGMLGVGIAPVPALVAGGVRVALGTDSLASVPDLDLFAEMAALRAEHPEIPPRVVIRMATWNGAAALGLDDRLGSIEPGKLARLVVIPLGSPDADPEELACSNPPDVQPLERARWTPAA